ncbi:hypothetical protein [Mucilaginibacter sp. L196]|uniref:hypothetical protein n=1 Tax=Mucilaginibacter sp. L196 TaxID=1641870 RepID=UPI00131CC1C7|nr:hypothetical protein [Mucilaginibacter sp. L196]
MQITVKDSELLQALKTQLAQYKTFDCKLRHENIIDVGSSEGIDSMDLPLEPIVNRVGFCNHSFRSVAISCAHTTAALKFKNLIGKISQQVEIPQNDLLIKTFDDLLCEIYLLDHKKGNLEKEYAFVEFYDKSGVDREEIKLEINKVGEQHSKLVAALELLRQTILTALDQLIY